MTTVPVSDSQWQTTLIESGLLPRPRPVVRAHAWCDRCGRLQLVAEVRWWPARQQMESQKGLPGPPTHAAGHFPHERNGGRVVKWKPHSGGRKDALDAETRARAEHRAAEVGAERAGAVLGIAPGTVRSWVARTRAKAERDKVSTDGLEQVKAEGRAIVEEHLARVARELERWGPPPLGRGEVLSPDPFGRRSRMSRRGRSRSDDGEDVLAELEAELPGFVPGTFGEVLGVGCDPDDYERHRSSSGRLRPRARRLLACESRLTHDTRSRRHRMIRATSNQAGAGALLNFSRARGQAENRTPAASRSIVMPSQARQTCSSGPSQRRWASARITSSSSST
jgi:hypothetical protein